MQDYQYWYGLGQSGGEYPNEEEFASEEEYIFACEAYEEGQADAYDGPMMEKTMRFSKTQLRRTIRRVLKESLHGHMDGNITNLVLHAAHLVGAEWGDITVADVLEKLHTMSEQEVIDHADPMDHDTLEYNEYFVSTIRQIDYDTVVDKMHELVELGELEDGYEDFFGLPGAV